MKPVVLAPRPKKRKRRMWKGVLVVFFATGLTTLAIHASDSFRIPDNSLLAGVGARGGDAHCPSDMAYVPASGGGFCIDLYEASAGKGCSHAAPVNQFETEDNLKDPLCTPVSVPDAAPWVNVPEHEALLLCAKAGKRLPTHREWYRAALGTPDGVSSTGDVCVLGRIGQSVADKTGTHSSCVSSYGAFDMVGNVWEWVDATAVNGSYDGRVLPPEGYIAEVDADGVPTKTSATSSPSFGDDYFSIDPTEVKGMFRGGFWAMNEKAGIYAVNVTIPTSFIGNAAGFRCAREAK